MPKKSKKKSASEASEAKNDAAETTAAASAKPARKRATTTRKPAARKKTSSKPVKTTDRPEPAVGEKSLHEPSDSDIRIRAYFIAERRTRLSLGGDPANDWIEARRQLIEEAKVPPR